MIGSERSAGGCGRPEHIRIQGADSFLLALHECLSILAMYMAKVHLLARKSTLALRQRRAALLHRLSVPPQAIRASVVERFGTCGKSNCNCHTGPKHGPYYYLTQCVAVGHMRKFLLKGPAALDSARTAVAAFNTFYDGLEELSQINTELLRRGEPLPGE
jgi:hypothetical protein